jgi:hypothetical protein
VQPVAVLMEVWGIDSKFNLSLKYAVVFGLDDAADHVHSMVQLIIVIDDHIIKRFKAFELLARGGDADGKRVDVSV